MNPRAYMFVTLAIAVQQIAASTDTQSAEAQLTQLDDVREAKATLRDPKEPANNVKTQRDFENIETPSDIEFSSSMWISKSHDIRRYTQATHNTWKAFVTMCKLPYVSNYFTMMGDNMAKFVENLNTNNLQEHIENARKKMIRALPLSKKTKGNIEEYTNSMTKKAMNCNVLKKGFEALRQTAQDAVVLLSTATAHCIRLKEDVHVNAYNDKSKTTEAPSTINKGLFKSGLQILKSLFEHFVHYHLTADNNKLSDQKWHILNSDEEELIQTNTEQPIKQITPTLTGYVQDKQLKNERENELDSEDSFKAENSSD